MNKILLWGAGKVLGDRIKIGAGEDPYYEDIPVEELGRKKPGSKRKRKIPDGLSHHDAKILKKVRSRAYCLDLSLSCCCGCKLGWAGVIGLIPFIGDFIAVLLAFRLLRLAEKIEGGLPPMIRAEMLMNISLDFGLGLIPIIGDLINIAYKCNSRNSLLLERYLTKKAAQITGNSQSQSQNQNGILNSLSNKDDGRNGAHLSDEDIVQPQGVYRSNDNTNPRKKDPYSHSVV